MEKVIIQYLVFSGFSMRGFDQKSKKLKNG